MSAPNFDERAASWDDDPRKIERARIVAEAILERCPCEEGSRVLDFGAGTGLLGMHFVKEQASVTFVDPSAGMRQQVEAKLEEGRHAGNHVVADLDEVEDERFDLVVTLMALHHVADPAEALAELGAHLVPGGKLAVCDLEPEDGSFHDPGTTGVHHGFASEQLETWSRQAGLVDFRCSRVTEIVNDSDPGRRTYPLFLMEARRAG